MNNMIIKPTISKLKDPCQARHTRRTRKALDRLEEVFGKHFEIEDFTPLRVILATIIANRGRGDPVWLLIVGPPSSLKTEYIQSLSGLKYIYPISLLTPKTLVSGDKEKEDASLLERLEDKTILAIKDFGSVLSMKPYDREEVLAQLREVYDGSYSKEFGTGKRVEWKGKLGLIAGCTGIIDKYHSVNQILGERFLLYRLEDCNRVSATRKALENAGKEEQIREDVCSAVNAFMKTVKQISDWSLGKEYEERLIALADFVTRARTGILREGYSRNIEYIPELEAPPRLAKQLSRLAYGLSCLTDEHRMSEENYKIICSVAESSLPQIRRDIIPCLRSSNAGRRAEEIAKEIGVPNIRMMYRTLEDLEVLEVVKHKKPFYKLTKDVKELLKKALP